MDERTRLHNGNIMFEHKFPTIVLEEQMKRIDSFEEFDAFYSDELLKENRLLDRYLYKLLEIHHTNPSAVAKEIGWSHDYVRKIANGEKTNPNRNVLLAICVQIKATVEETQTLLRYAGQRPLYARSRRDAIIWYALTKGQSLRALNEYLHDKKEDMLSKNEG